MLEVKIRYYNSIQELMESTDYLCIFSHVLVQHSHTSSRVENLGKPIRKFFKLSFNDITLAQVKVHLFVKKCRPKPTFKRTAN